MNPVTLRLGPEGAYDQQIFGVASSLLPAPRLVRTISVGRRAAVVERLAESNCSPGTCEVDLVVYNHFYVRVAGNHPFCIPYFLHHSVLVLLADVLSWTLQHLANAAWRMHVVLLS